MDNSLNPDQNALPPGLAALMSRAGQSRGPAPVHLWNPEFCGKIDMRIDRNGRWYYMGSPIGRPALVRLFSSVLKHEEGRHFLVTPVEKVEIDVEDVPFTGVEIHSEEEGRSRKLTVRTNVGDVVSIDRDHPIRFEEDAENGGIRPYIHVRGGLEARLERPLLYEMMEWAGNFEIDGATKFGLWSNGVFFAIADHAVEDVT